MRICPPTRRLGLESSASLTGIVSRRSVHASVDELLRQPEVEIVDIAVYPAEQVVIVEQATAAGKHLLCQKPFADEYSKAVHSVELAERVKVKIAVNQQMRWDLCLHQRESSSGRNHASRNQNADHLGVQVRPTSADRCLPHDLAG